MAVIVTARALDMRTMVDPGDVLEASTTRIKIIAGPYVALFSGDFSYPASGGLSGTLTGYRLTIDGRTLFDVSQIERSAGTALGLLGNNDAFAAYCLSGDDSITGGRRSDYLIGFGGSDTLRGGEGSDLLFGGGDRDRLLGGPGNDLLAGGEDVDVMEGQDGDDTYVVDQRTDRVIERHAAGTDLVLASASVTLSAHVENLTLTGAASISGTGNRAGNVLRGNEAANTLRGEAGGDSLSGSGGNDILIGGTGRDSLSGGVGSDVFRFRSVEETGNGRHADRILDFVHGSDRIDLSRIDADPQRSGDQAFKFVGTAAFSGSRSELRWEGDLVRGDLDGDGRGDLTLFVATTADLKAGDFIL